MSLPDLDPVGQFGPMQSLTAVELEALSRLGPDAWARWAAKGWVETT